MYSLSPILRLIIVSVAWLMYLLCFVAAFIEPRIIGTAPEAPYSGLLVFCLIGLQILRAYVGPIEDELTGQKLALAIFSFAKITVFVGWMITLLRLLGGVTDSAALRHNGVLLVTGVVGGLVMSAVFDGDSAWRKRQIKREQKASVEADRTRVMAELKGVVANLPVEEADKFRKVVQQEFDEEVDRVLGSQHDMRD